MGLRQPAGAPAQRCSACTWRLRAMKRPFGGGLPAGALQQRLAQGLQPGPVRADRPMPPAAGQAACPRADVGLVVHLQDAARHAGRRAAMAASAAS
jgi:hypothetical protein